MTAPTVASRCDCGVPDGSALPRCAACPRAVPATVTGRFVPPVVTPTTYRSSRWRKGPTTFGPAGRLVATFLLLLPVPVLLLTMAIGIGIAGMVAYCGFVLPLALREVWKVARLPA